MYNLILHLFIASSLLLAGTSATHYTVKQWTLHQLMPLEESQCDILRKARDSNSGVLFWNGIGSPGDPVDVISSQEAFDHFEEQLKDQQAGKFNYDKFIKVRLVANDVKIELDNITYGGQHDYNHIHTGNDHGHAEEHDDETITTHNLVPVHKIKGTSLYSGIFYTIRIPVFPSAWVTWTSKETPDGKANYVQIDNTPDHFPHYAPGEKWYEDIQWAFIPSEIKGYYTMTLKGDLSARVMAKEGAKDEYNYLVLAKARDLITSSKRGGPLRDSVLFRPIPPPSGDHVEVDEYQLKVKSFPEETSTITWTEAKYGNHSHYIQVSTNPNHILEYKPGAKWFNDTLFKFTPTDVDLVGFISSINLKMKDIVTIKPHREIIKKFRLRNNNPTKVEYSMKDKMSVLTTSEIQLDDYEEWKSLLKNIKIDAVLPHLNSAGFQTELKINLNNVSDSSEATETLSWYSIKRNIAVFPETTSEITIFIDQVKNVEVPFEAIMSISGKTSRIDGDMYSLTPGQLPGELVRDILINSGVVQESLVPSEAVVHNGVLIRVSGTFKGSFTVDGGILAEAFIQDEN